MDGSFEDLDAESIEGEVEEYWREIYKIQKLFNVKLKKLQAEREERERERKKRKRHTDDSEENKEEDKEEPEVTPPSALTICNTVQDQMKDFKVSWFLFVRLSVFCSLIWYEIKKNIKTVTFQKQ